MNNNSRVVYIFLWKKKKVERWWIQLWHWIPLLYRIHWDLGGPHCLSLKDELSCIHEMIEGRRPRHKYWQLLIYYFISSDEKKPKTVLVNCFLKLVFLLLKIKNYFKDGKTWFEYLLYKLLFLELILKIVAFQIVYLNNLKLLLVVCWGYFKK